MDFERAHEILQSKGVIDVEHNGTSIWIKELNEENESAQIDAIDGSFSSKVVNVNELNETMEK
jgi:H-type small acid-soluble spore protein